MTIRKYVDGEKIVNDMTETWGENLEHLNISEKLWLIRNGIASWINWEVAQQGMDPNVFEAGEELVGAPESFKIKVVYGFCKYLVDEYQPLSYYLSDRDYSGWIKAAMESWGDRLQNIPENDGFIFIFNTATDPIDFNDLPNLEGLHECLKAFDAYSDETVFALISAIAELAHDQYFAK